MIITKKEPFTKEEIEKLSEELETYIKTVIDIKEKICSAGGHLHFDNEQILLKKGSKQINLWGGGIDTSTLTIDLNAMINLRPIENPSNEILNSAIRNKFEKLMKYFFPELNPSWTR